MVAPQGPVFPGEGSLSMVERVNKGAHEHQNIEVMLRMRLVWMEMLHIVLTPCTQSSVVPLMAMVVLEELRISGQNKEHRRWSLSAPETKQGDAVVCWRREAAQLGDALVREALDARSTDEREEAAWQQSMTRGRQVTDEGGA